MLFAGIQQKSYVLYVTFTGFVRLLYKEPLLILMIEGAIGALTGKYAPSL